MKSLLLACMSMLTCVAHADSSAYRNTRRIEAERSSLRVIHVHDWSSPKIADLFLDLQHHAAFLGEKNDFSYIEAKDETGKVLFRRPSSALTQIWISPDSKYIVGLSSVMLYNPYQIMIWRTDGTLIYKEHISVSLAKLAPDDFAKLGEKFPAAAEFLRERCRKINGAIYVDYAILGVPNKIGDDAWRFLWSHRVPNPYSSDFSSSVTNWIGWFDEKDAKLRIEESSHQVAVILASPNGLPFRIVITNEKRPEQASEPTAGLRSPVSDF